MKTRNGFVSNSSSSSFITAFPDIPKDTSDLRHMMFGSETELEDFYGFLPSIDDVVKSVAYQMGEQEPTVYDNNDEYPDVLVRGHFDGIAETHRYPTYDKVIEEAAKNGIHDPWDHKDWSEKVQSAWEYDVECVNREVEASARETWRKFLQRAANKPVYVFEFSDHDGELHSYMEHGNIFRKLPHIRISQH